MASATVQMAGYAIRGTYQGGAYIDLHFGGEPEAFDVINVYDYAAGKPTIRNTPAEVRRAMKEWMIETGDSLAHDLRAHRENMYPSLYR